MKSLFTRHLTELLMATLFISTSGVLGRYIDLPTPVIIWWRCVLGGLFLFVLSRVMKLPLRLRDRHDMWAVFWSAVFLGGHWITYFHALKVSNVAIGMLSIHTYPVITALLEPLFLKKRLDPVHIVLAIVVLAGVYIMVPELDLQRSEVTGMLFGILSAILYSLRNIILKTQINRYNGVVLMHHQLAILTIVLLPVLFLFDSSNIETQYPYVIILALLTTAIGHTLFVRSFKHFSITTASLISSALPVFGILMGVLFLAEIPGRNTIIGGVLIITTVVVEALRSRSEKQ